MNLKSIHNLPHVLTCTTNTNYLKYLIVLLESLAENSPDTVIVVRLVNCNSNIEEKLLSMYNNVVCLLDNNKDLTKDRIINKSEIDNKSIQYLLSNKKWLYTHEGAYCSNIKFNTINKLLSLGIYVVTYVDVDTIIMNNLNGIPKEMKGYDIGMYINEPEVTDTYFGWNAGIQIAINTPITNKLYTLIESDIIDNMFDIEADEDLFDDYYRSLRDEINLKKLSIKYKDDGPLFCKDSYMWSGHAENKFDNKMFIDQYDQFFNIEKLQCLEAGI